MPSDDQTQHLTVMMTELVTKMQVLIDKHAELADNISKIKEAVYNPDKGLYARLNKLDARLDILEAWKNNNSKIQEFRRMKKIAQNNLYNNNNLRKKNLWEILAGV